jgi:hypothetical protein
MIRLEPQQAIQFRKDDIYIYIYIVSLNFIESNIEYRISNRISHIIISYLDNHIVVENLN